MLIDFFVSRVFELSVYVLEVETMSLHRMLEALGLGKSHPK